MTPLITVCLLNYKRPANVQQIITALRSQTEKPNLFLWDNSETEADRVSSGLDWYVQSGRNMGCMPRWWMATFSASPYVVVLDDDLIPTDKEFLADLLFEFEKVSAGDSNRILGCWGKWLVGPKAYEWCETRDNGDVDIVLGRCMILRSESLRRLSIPFWDRDLRTADDVCISGLLAGEQICRHVVSRSLGMRLQELPDPHAACKEEGHFSLREVARRRFHRA